jgi:hypothetical protein
MKITAIIAMLVVFALFATPLWTTNAKAETIDDPVVIDTTGADWDYCIYGDANGYIIFATKNTEIHGEDGGDTIDKLPGPAQFSGVIIYFPLRDGTPIIEWTFNVGEDIEPFRMGGKIALCQSNGDGEVLLIDENGFSLMQRDGTPIIEWTFENGQPLRYEGPRLNTLPGEGDVPLKLPGPAQFSMVARLPFYTVVVE